MSSNKKVKLAPAVSKKSSEAKYVIPGFGKFPPGVKPAAYLPMPFPGQFLQALFPIAERVERPIPKAFTKSWRKRWLTISSDVSDHSSKKCSEFFDGDGLSALRELTNRGCNPNLVMSLLSRFLWDESVSQQEQNDPNAVAHQQDLKAVQNTRILFRNHTWQRTAETQLVEKALDGLESIIQSYFDQLDFRVGRGLQKDKENRVIFAIHCHLLKKNVGPQWRLMLRMFVAAGAILFKTSRNPVSDSADRRIAPRLKSFEKDHPKEAHMMPDWVSDWPSNYPLTPSE